MSSTSVTQHASQPLNFGPEWLRALSTPDSATSIPSSAGSGNVFKFSAIKYRYSKDEILAMRANVAERLAENIQNEIITNLKDVENVFRADIVDPLALTPPTAEETAKMNALSSYISGRTPGGAGRPGNNSQQSQADSRMSRGGGGGGSNGGGGGAMSNGRGSSSRGRGARDNNNFGSTRGNNNNNNHSDENGENGTAGDDTSAATSSWSRNNHHSRGGAGGGGGSFGNRVRSFDEREQSQTFRRGAGRQSSDGWRRSRGDDDDNANTNNEPGDDSSPAVNGSSSWTSARNGPARRVNSNGSTEQRTKSNEKWSHNDGSASGGGWRTNSSTSDRDFNSRRPPTKREQMPEWMDDNNDDDTHLNNATFEQDGTFTRSASHRSNDHDEKRKTPSTSEDSSISTKQEDEEPKSDKSISHFDQSAVHVPAPEPLASHDFPVHAPAKTVPQPSMPSWDDEFDHHDLATTVVESTLAEDHDYSPPISAQPTPRLLAMDPSQQPSIPQARAPPVIDDKQWFYKDPQNTVQGPFSSADMERWFNAGYFTVNLPVKRLGETQFSTIQQLSKEVGYLPFRTDLPPPPPPPPAPVQKPSPSQKFNPLAYSSSSSNAFLDDYLMQQSRQATPQSFPFNRQASVPADRKPLSNPSSVASHLQSYFNPSNSSPLAHESALTYQQQQQQQQQMHRSLSSSNHYDSYPRSSSNSSSTSSFFPSQPPVNPSNDLLSRLSQAMQVHSGKEQRRPDYEFERSKLYEQPRLPRDEEEKRKLQLQQEFALNRQSNLDQLSKTMDIEALVAFQQQAKIEAQQAENIRRYQQHYGEQPMYNNWNRSNYSFLDNPEQERHAREAASNAFASQFVCPKQRKD